MNLPTLYKKTSTGANQEWTVSTQDNVIITRWGQVGGAIQETRDTISKGKNEGRKNATTPRQQAESEAKSLWEGKLKKGYVQSLKDAQAGKIDGIIEGGIFPMLAHKFNEHGDRIAYPAYAQPKMDGHRCIGMGGQLWTRTRKPITGLPHINEAIADIQVTLDGELYNHAWRGKFEELTSLIRSGVPKPEHKVVEYHIYDIAAEGTWEERYTQLRRLRLEKPLVRVETLQVNSEGELMEAFDHFTKQGFEGCMVRNAKGLYVNKRSYDLLKVKEFDDDEFKIVGLEEGRGKLAGHAMFVCETDKGLKFTTKMMGEVDQLKKFFDKPSLVVGRMVTVKYQGYTKSNVPRFPVAVRFRDE